MTHHSSVSDTVFAKIISGERQIEPRLNDEAHKRIRLGDMIIFTNRQNNAEVVAKVVGIVRYSSFQQLFEAFPLRYFGGETMDALHQEVAAWATPAAEVRQGVLGVKLHVLKK